MKKVMLIMAAALLMMTQCKKENETPTDPAEGTVKMTVTAGPGRTDISTETGAITWSEGDKLYVSDGTNWLGSLTLQSGEGTPQGTFTGSVTGLDDEGAPCHFFYLGKGNIAMTPTGTAAVSISLASQDGTLRGENGAMKYHLGYGNTSVTVSEGEATGSVVMSTKIAIAHINFTDGTSAYTGSLTMGGTGISNTLSVSPDGSFSGSGTDGITIGGTTGERYVTLIPTTGTDRVDVAFTGDAAGSMTFAKGIHENKFYGMSSAMMVTVHEYVDLGLPSGTLWATCNVGADSPEKYGDYFAWGETKAKSCYDWSTYKWCNGSNSTLTKYNTNSEYGTDPDNKTVLEPEDDAARVNWGSDWRMPTTAEWQELYSNTNSTRTTENGVNGCKFTSKTDAAKSIFLPAAGCRNGTDVCYPGSVGVYWSSSLRSSNPSLVYVMGFNSDGVYQKDFIDRYLGCTVRPVCVLLGSS